MCKPLDLQRPLSHESVLLAGGCHGTCFLRSSNDEDSRTANRQFVLANCLVLAASLSIVALVIALVWISSPPGTVPRGSPPGQERPS